MTTRTERLGSWPGITGVLVLLLLAALLTLEISPGIAGTATWWPAAGIASALVVWVAPSRRLAAAVGVVLATGAANYIYGRPAEIALAFGFCNALEALTVAWLLRGRADPRPTLHSLPALLRVFLATTAGAVVFAVLAGGLTTAAGGDYVTSSRALFASHLAATMVILPAVLSLDQRGLRRSPVEYLLQALSLVATLAYVFSPDQHLANTTAPLPSLAWAAFRFGPRAVAWQLVAVAVIASAATAAGNGPFAITQIGDVDPVLAGSLAQIFLITVVLACLPLAVVTEQSALLTERLRASSELFRKNFAESLLAMLVLRGTPEGLVIHDANRTAAELLGQDPDDLVGRPLADLVHTETPLALTGQRLARGELDSWRDEGDLPCRPGSRVALSVAGLSGGQDERMFSAQLLDLTAERTAQAGLLEERQLSDITLATTASMILVLDPTGVVMRANAAVTRLLDRREEDILGRPVWEVAVPAEHRDLAATMFVRPDFSAVPRSIEAPLTAADGEEHRIAWTSGVVTHPDGSARFIVLTGLDVTAERNAAGLMQHLLQAAITTAIIGVDLAGRITLFNAGARVLLGRTGSLEADYMTGTPFLDLFEPETLAEWSERLGVEPSFEALVRHAASQDPEDWTWRNEDGESLVVSMALSRITDHRGHLLGYLCVASDVTEARHHQELLVAALDKERQVVDRLRDLDSAKDEFVSTVSHELRTPVASIIGYTELLQDGDFGELSAEQEPALDAIGRNGERLITLVDNLLTLSGLTSGSLTWERQLIDLRDVAAECRRAMRPWLDGRSLEVCFELPEDPVRVDADLGQMRRMLLNLLSNAVKFTEDGGHVRCTLSREGEEAVLTVTDDGLGIHEDEVPHVFERFWRGTTSQTRQIQGTGLGLPIVHAIVSIHGGTVGVRSRHLAGTTLCVRLPHAQDGPRRTTATL